MYRAVGKPIVGANPKRIAPPTIQQFPSFTLGGAKPGIPAGASLPRNNMFPLKHNQRGSILVKGTENIIGHGDIQHAGENTESRQDSLGGAVPQNREEGEWRRRSTGHEERDHA